MVKRLMFSLLVLCAGAAYAAGDAPSAAARDPARITAERAHGERAMRACGDTGTRIRGANTSAPLRCYDRERLQRTGAIGLAEALRRLDPALR